MSWRFNREPGLLKKSNGDFSTKHTMHENKNSIGRFNRLE